MRSESVVNHGYLRGSADSDDGSLKQLSLQVLCNGNRDVGDAVDETPRTVSIGWPCTLTDVRSRRGPKMGERESLPVTYYLLSQWRYIDDSKQ